MVNNNNSIIVLIQWPQVQAMRASVDHERCSQVDCIIKFNNIIVAMLQIILLLLLWSFSIYVLELLSSPMKPGDGCIIVGSGD